MNYTAEMNRIIEEDGPWTAHSFVLPDGAVTYHPQHRWAQDRADLAFNQARMYFGHRKLRALDIGSLEGGVAIRLAEVGCEVVGLEIRESSLRKARFVADALGVHVDWVQGDMLKLPELGLGVFDLIVGAGILYHVDAPDLLPFLTSLNDCCRGIAVFDTHISLNPTESYDVGGGCPPLLGQSIVEHFGEVEEEKAAALWASAHNKHSFWPTERSLANLLIRAGFAQVIKPLAPTLEWKWKDRDFWTACSRKLVAERVGINPAALGFISEPDVRPDLSDLMANPVYTSIPNPATQPHPAVAEASSESSAAE